MAVLQFDSITSVDDCCTRATAPVTPLVRPAKKSRGDHCRMICAPPTCARLAALSVTHRLAPHHPKAEARRSFFLRGSAVRPLFISSRLLQSKAPVKDSRSCLSAGRAHCCNSTNEATTTLESLSLSLASDHFPSLYSRLLQLLLSPVRYQDCSPSTGAKSFS